MRKVIKWAGRFIGGGGAAIFLFIMIVGGISGDEQWTMESTILTLLGIASAISIIIAWKNEKTGGIFLTTLGIFGIIFGCIAAGHNNFLAALITGGPFLTSGILFLVNSLFLKK